LLWGNYSKQIKLKNELAGNVVFTVN
jgi:hypothetical protein